VATYAIGDVQGCFEPLQRLLQRIAFDPDRDRLWLAGDLVNRGPGSLEVLRWARGLGPRLTAVLGNHDLHLLSAALGARPPKPRDTLEPVLSAPDRDELLAWVRGLPLLHREGDRVMVHAGLLPAWSVAEAEELAREAEAAIRGPGLADLLAGLGDAPSAWSPDLPPAARVRLTIVALTRLRTCTADGVIEPEFSGPPDGAPPGRLPWFEVPGRRSADATVVFGHWAALGLHRAPGVVGLDSGCVWGGALTAVRLEDEAVFQVACR